MIYSKKIIFALIWIKNSFDSVFHPKRYVASHICGLIPNQNLWKFL